MVPCASVIFELLNVKFTTWTLNDEQDLLTKVNVAVVNRRNVNILLNKYILIRGALPESYGELRTSLN